jgi:hypothetical protein
MYGGMPLKGCIINFEISLLGDHRHCFGAMLEVLAG